MITVAGTNGKGSTIALLEAILIKAGYRVGVFTSPHFIRFNERIRINGQQVEDDNLCNAFARINQGRGATWLTYFEFATLAAVDCFKNAKVDIALMEVGLGGRLDATNVVDPDISIVTTVSLDHQDWLGYSIEAIAKEKAGIFRTEKPAIYGDHPVPKSVIETAVRRETPLFRRDREFSITVEGDHWRWQGMVAGGAKVSYERLPLPELLIDNAATALQALQFMPEVIPEQAIVEGLISARLTGRFQTLELENPEGEPIPVILDVAHNPQAAQKLNQKLKKSGKKTRAVFAMYADKEAGSVIEALGESISEWFVSEFESPRKLSAEQLCSQLDAREQQFSHHPTVLEALDSAVNASVKGEQVVVCGSFVTVAEVLTAHQ